MTKPHAKARERGYAEQCASLLKLEWVLEPRERPDFIVTEGERRFGLEVTYVFQDRSDKFGSDLRHGEGQTQKIITDIRREFERRSNDLTVKVEFKQRPRATDAEDIVAKLLGLNLSSRSIGERHTIHTQADSEIVAMRYRWPEWTSIPDRVGWVVQDASQQLQACIAKKADELPPYRAAAGDDVRLLVVADRTLNSGKLLVPSPEGIEPMGFGAVYFLTHPLEVVVIDGG